MQDRISYQQLQAEDRMTIASMRQQGCSAWLRPSCSHPRPKAGSPLVSLTSIQQPVREMARMAGATAGRPHPGPRRASSAGRASDPTGQARDDWSALNIRQRRGASEEQTRSSKPDQAWAAISVERCGNRRPAPADRDHWQTASARAGSASSRRDRRARASSANWPRRRRRPRTACRAHGQGHGDVYPAAGRKRRRANDHLLVVAVDCGDRVPRIWVSHEVLAELRLQFLNAPAHRVRRDTKTRAFRKAAAARNVDHSDPSCSKIA